MIIMDIFMAVVGFICMIVTKMYSSSVGGMLDFSGTSDKLFLISLLIFLWGVFGIVKYFVKKQNHENEASDKNRGMYMPNKKVCPGCGLSNISENCGVCPKCGRNLTKED